MARVTSSKKAAELISKRCSRISWRVASAPVDTLRNLLPCHRAVGQAGVGAQCAAGARAAADSARPISASSDTTACSSACAQLATRAEAGAAGAQLAQTLAEFGQGVEQRRDQVGARGVGIQRQPRGVAQITEPAQHAGDGCGVGAEVGRPIQAQPLVGQARQRAAHALPARLQRGPAGLARDCTIERAIAALSSAPSARAWAPCPRCHRARRQNRPRCCCVLRMTAKPASNSSGRRSRARVTRISSRRLVKICVSRITEATAQTRMIRPNLSG